MSEKLFGIMCIWICVEENLYSRGREQQSKEIIYSQQLKGMQRS